MEGSNVDNIFLNPSTVPEQTEEPRAPAPLVQHVVFRDDNLRDLILQHLGQPTALLALARTCKEYRKLIMETRFDINARLKRFNLDCVTGFRTELGRAGALISGGFALQFLLGARGQAVWKDLDLDVVVERGRKMAGLEGFLVEEEGFALIETPQVGWAKRGIDRRTYSKTSEEYGTARIHLVQCTGPPIQAILAESPSSCVMNFISWNKAYSVFPRTTFLNRKTLPLTPQSGYSMNHLHQYELRGFPFLGWNESPRTGSSSHGIDSKNGAKVEAETTDASSTRHRSIGDRHTWKLPLDTTGITLPPPPPAGGEYPPDFVLESSTFTMQYKTCKPDPDIQSINDMAGWPPHGNALTTHPADPLCSSSSRSSSTGGGGGLWRYVKLAASTYTHPSLRYAYTDDRDHVFFDGAFVEALEKRALYVLLVKLGVLKGVQKEEEVVVGQLGEGGGGGATMSNSDYVRFLRSIYSCPYVLRDPRLEKWTYLDDMVRQRKEYVAQYGYNKPASQFELFGF